MMAPAAARMDEGVSVRMQGLLGCHLVQKHQCCYGGVMVMCVQQDGWNV
jgi:hypothetical protein